MFMLSFSLHVLRYDEYPLNSTSRQRASTNLCQYEINLHSLNNSLSTVMCADVPSLCLVIWCFLQLLILLIIGNMQGKYRTVLYLSIVYCVGNWAMALSAFPDPDPTTRKFQFRSTRVALGLIAVGTGGIKPCVAAFGGDQIEHSLADGPIKDRLQRQFFSMYYFAVNAGSVLSTILTPILRTDISYSVAFAVPAVLMMFASLIFWAGRNTYIDRPPEGNVFADVAIVIVDAVKLRRINENPEHWLDNAKAKHSSCLVEDVKGLLRVLALLLPTPLFWSLFDQQASKWVFQASTLDGRVLWLFGLVIQPDQMQVRPSLSLSCFHMILYWVLMAALGVALAQQEIIYFLSLGGFTL